MEVIIIIIIRPYYYYHISTYAEWSDLVGFMLSGYRPTFYYDCMTSRSAVGTV